MTMILRGLIVLLALLMLPVTAGAASKVAKDSAPPGKTRKPDGMPQEVRTFILGNVLFTLYHELGHALIHELQLPVLGREEDAVDNLASLLMVPEAGDREMADRVLAAAQGWLMSATNTDEDEELAFWDEHGLDMQRFYSVVCVLYGADPDRFGDFADEADLPDYRREACGQEYEQISTSWAKLLEPHMIADGDKRRSRVRVVHETPAPEYRKLSALLRESRLMETVAEDVRTGFVLPHELTIRAAACDEANAYFDPEDLSVTLCYELLEEFEAQITADLEEADDE
ncbi:hypothetical protein GCM10027256_03820 [Novispirillum itersonii subsp. nipponicum]|uniref:Metallopeptidase n=2 Tax=Novispirillum itersonii TaxID=189 RepID=A0A7W9ZC65_NOVIT|nr:hypothetical protein [Novispirillum itersonii]